MSLKSVPSKIVFFDWNFGRLSPLTLPLFRLLIARQHKEIPPRATQTPPHTFDQGAAHMKCAHPNLKSTLLSRCYNCTLDYPSSVLRATRPKKSQLSAPPSHTPNLAHLRGVQWPLSRGIRWSACCVVQISQVQKRARVSVAPQTPSPLYFLVKSAVCARGGGTKSTLIRKLLWALEEGLLDP